jgi:protein involved in polysaccharide export with SLBB domain
MMDSNVDKRRREGTPRASPRNRAGIIITTTAISRTILARAGVIGLLCLVSALVSAATAAEAQTPTSAAPPVFRAGDAVRVTVWGNTEFGGEFEIAEDGTVIHPLYRVIRIAGLSLPQAEAEFVRVIQRFISQPELVVEPLFRVAITGAVNAPGIFTVSSNSTLAMALSQAGGPSATADLSRVNLIRDGRELRLDLRNPDNEFARTPIRSGDQIFVAPRTSLWRDRLEPAIRTIGSFASIAYLIIRVSTDTR